MKPARLAAGTGRSITIDRCQVCDSSDLQDLLFVGYLPPVNGMPLVGTRPQEQPAYPAQLLRCRECQLVQLGCVVDPAVLFPPSYPYTSGSTRILRENFAELSSEIASLYPLRSSDLVIDIGSNDGTLLANFQAAGARVLGIEPTDAGKIAVARGINTMTAFFSHESAARAVKENGKAKLVTAANVFAHIENVHSIVDSIVSMLSDDGIFVSESHYLASLIDTVQYDTIYHEHLRYYSLTSLKNLLQMHGLRVVHAKKIPTHGGSIRVYATRDNNYPATDAVNRLLTSETDTLSDERLTDFRDRVVDSKLGLHALLKQIKESRHRVYGIGAPSRASTLINYVGLDDGILECVLEISGSYKIGKYMPGTVIPVLDESRLFQDQPEYAMLLSWHIADELIPKLRARGFKGKFIVPLPVPRLVN